MKCKNDKSDLLCVVNHKKQIKIIDVNIYSFGLIKKKLDVKRQRLLNLSYPAIKIRS